MSYRIVKLLKLRGGDISETDKLRIMALDGPIFIQSINDSIF